MKSRTRQRVVTIVVAVVSAVSLRIVILTNCVAEGRPVLAWEQPDPLPAWNPDVLSLEANPAGPEWPQPRQPARNFQHERDAFRRALETWEAASLRDYSFVLEHSCFCGPETTQPRRVVVRDGRVSFVEYVELEGWEPPNRPSEGMTVDEAFDLVRTTQHRGVYRLSATFDARLGYPTSLSVDGEWGVSDDEWSMSIRDFRVLEADLRVDRANR